MLRMIDRPPTISTARGTFDTTSADCSVLCIGRNYLFNSVNKDDDSQSQHNFKLQPNKTDPTE